MSAPDNIRRSGQTSGSDAPGPDEHPLVSICIRNYNYAQFLPEAIESCLHQTYDRVEVIVVDDGSTDNSREVLATYEHHVRVIRQPNTGMFNAAVTAFKAATGAYVICLDADDRLHAGTAARVVEAFGRRPDAGRVQWRLSIITADGSPTGLTSPRRSWRMPDGDLREHVLRRRTYLWPQTSGNAYRHDTIDLVLRCLEPEHGAGDIDLLLAEATPLIGPVVTLPGTGADYRWHSSSDTVQTKRDPVTFLHRRIDEIVAAQGMLVRLGEALQLDPPVDPDPRTALDWAFAAYRLGSLRLDAPNHPFADDRVFAVAVHGIRSVLGQPDYSLRAKVRRAGWFAATALSPQGVARRLVERAFVTNQVNPASLGQHAEVAAAPARRAHSR